MAEQRSILEVLDRAAPEFEDQVVPIFEIFLPSGETDPQVDTKMVESVRRFGILSPILVRKRRGPGFTVIDGRRRLGAAEAAELPEVPVRIVTGRNRELLDATLTLQGNTHRNPNYVAELHAIETLISKGADSKQLVEATGLTQQQVHARLRLQKLHPRIREGWEKGKVGLKAAEAAARLDVSRQEKLAGILEETDKLRTEDVNEMRKVASTAVIDSLDDELFSQVGLPPWQERAAYLLDQVLAVVPKDGEKSSVEFSLRKNVEKLRASISG